MTRESLVENLEKIALLLELKGENPFKVKAYRSGAESVSSYQGDVVRAAQESGLKGVKGIGTALQEKIQTLASTGSLPYLETLKQEFPESLFDLFDIQGLGPKKIKALYDELGVDSLDRLRQACHDGSAATLKGFGEKSVSKLLEEISYSEANSAFVRQDKAAASVEWLLEFLRSQPETIRASAAGSWRRAKEILHDIDLIVATRQPGTLMASFVSAPFVKQVIAQGETKSSIRMGDGTQVDLRAVSNEEFPFALQYFTGSKEHNVALRSRARSRGWTLNEYRLARLEGHPAEDDNPAILDEDDIYRFLGLQPIDPALREDRGEIDAASSGRLPKLVELSDIRGTFHNHTTASDGDASLEEMAEAAIDLGLEYLGIADHSKSSFQANGLDEARLLRQIDDIRHLNGVFQSTAANFRLFAGSEVDILKDGRLDYPDEILAQLDYAVASIHSSFSLSGSQMTRRLITAAENPHITMLGHLTGRLLLRREAYQVDVPAVIEACAATGTVIELNASPWRLDMDWRWWHQAKQSGVRCSINPDAHSTSGLQSLYFGVRCARKGWLEKADVINTMPLQVMQGWLKAGSPA